MTRVSLWQQKSERVNDMKKIQEAVTFIKATREEAITLANDIVGDAEVHALVIQKGFTANPEPVGYMVVPLAKEWVGLTREELAEIFANCDLEERGAVAHMVEVKLRNKNTWNESLERELVAEKEWVRQLTNNNARLKKFLVEAQAEIARLKGEWVGLTDDEIEHLRNDQPWWMVRDIEAKLREKNT